MSFLASAGVYFRKLTWFHWLLIGLIGLGLSGLWWRLDQPNEFVFDERYHVPAARAVLQGDWRIFDWWQPPLGDAATGIYADWLHPPVFKYLQAASIAAFGDQPWAWRFPSALAATIVVGLVFGLGWQVGARRGRLETGLLAAAFTAMSGLWLVQGRTGMNDMVLTMSGLGAVWAYSCSLKANSARNRGWLLLAGSLAGLAAATKWTGWLVVVGLVGLEGWRQRARWQRWPWIVISLLVVPVAIYILAFWPIWATGRGEEHFFKLHQAIWQYQTTRDHSHPDQSMAWQWPLNWRAVQYSETSFVFENRVLNVVLLGGAVTWFARLFWLRAQRHKIPQNTWLGVIYLAWWFPLLFSPRILFQYHYLPAVPVLAVMTALLIQPFIHRLTKVGWLTVVSLLSLVGLGWLLSYPHWIGLPVPLW